MSASSAPGQSKSSPKSHAIPIVFVVDDDISVRESLELLIRSEGWQPETFESAQEFLAHPRALVPSCLVLDVSLPGLNGLELQKRVAVEQIDMPIIFITGYGDVPMTVQAMKAGAVEFLTKPFGDEVLLSAIRQAIERSRAALGHEAKMRSIRDAYASLSRRERQVMALVVRGLLNKQVGGELGISEITVPEKLVHLTPEEAAKQSPDFLFDELAKRIARKPVVFHLKAQLAEPGDQTKDASQPWPDDRKVVELGVLTLNKVVPNTLEAEKKLLFQPTNLTAGIELSDDPLPLVRAAAYGVSFGRRSQ